jgi:hypothetical protein
VESKTSGVVRIDGRRNGRLPCNLRLRGREQIEILRHPQAQPEQEQRRLDAEIQERRPVE